MCTAQRPASAWRPPDRLQEPPGALTSAAVLSSLCLSVAASYKSIFCGLGCSGTSSSVPDDRRYFAAAARAIPGPRGEPQITTSAGGVVERPGPSVERTSGESKRSSNPLCRAVQRAGALLGGVAAAAAAALHARGGLCATGAPSPKPRLPRPMPKGHARVFCARRAQTWMAAAVTALHTAQWGWDDRRRCVGRAAAA